MEEFKLIDIDWERIYKWTYEWCVEFQEKTLALWKKRICLYKVKQRKIVRNN